MPDVPVIAVVTARAGSEATVAGELAALAAASRQEDGCLDSAVHESISSPGTFLTLERWAGQEHLERHRTSPPR